MPDTALLETPTQAAAAGPQLPAVNVVSVATEVPAGRVSSADIAAGLGISEDWILSRTGIRERPRAAPEERLCDFSARAGAKALLAAGISAADLDLVIVATITPDQITPAVASQVAAALGAVRAGAFDVSAACTGFLTGLAIAAGQIESGRATKVLLIGADFLSRITDLTDRRTAPLFADAAGAVVLCAGPRPGDAASVGRDTSLNGRPSGGVGPVILGADGGRGQALYANHDERKLVMDGPEVFRNAVARMHEASLAALAASHTTLADIDLFVYHQANARITRALRERLDLDESRVVDCIEWLGNSSAATLPLALAQAQSDGRLQRGTCVLLSAFGAGLTWGACVLHWGGSEPQPSTILSTSPHSSGPAAPSPARV